MKSNYEISKSFNGTPIRRVINLSDGRDGSPTIMSVPKLNIGVLYKNIPLKYNKKEYSDLIALLNSKDEINYKILPLKQKHQLELLNEISRLTNISMNDVVVNSYVYSFLDHFKWNLNNIHNFLAKCSASYIKILSLFKHNINIGNITIDDYYQLSNILLTQPFNTVNECLFYINFKLSEADSVFSPDPNLIMGLLYNDIAIKKFLTIYVDSYTDIFVAGIIPTTIKPKSTSFMFSLLAFFSNNFIIIDRTDRFNANEKQQLMALKHKSLLKI